MKKKNLKSLKLNKNSISNLSSTEVTGKGPLTINQNCDNVSRDCVPTVMHTNTTCGFTFDYVCNHFTKNNDCFGVTRERSICLC